MAGDGGTSLGATTGVRALKSPPQHSGNQVPPSLFPLKIPLAGWCPQGLKGHLAPHQHGSCITGWRCRGMPGRQPWPRGMDSGHRRLCQCLLCVVRLTQPQGLRRKFGGAWWMLRGRKHPKAAGRHHEQLPRLSMSPPLALRLPACYAPALPSLLPSPPAPSQHPCQHLKADFSSCHQSVTGCGWPWHLDLCAMQDMASWLPLCQGALSDGEGMSDLLAEFGGFLSC